MAPTPDDTPAHDQHRASPRAPELMPRVYESLRSLANAYLRYEQPGHTLQPTALVHEAYMRLAKIDRMEFSDEAHFARAASTREEREQVARSGAFRDAQHRLSALRRAEGVRFTAGVEPQNGSVPRSEASESEPSKAGSE